MLDGLELKRRHDAYKAHDTDAAAAAALGLHRKTYGAWRRAAGLPSKQHSRTLSPEEHAQRLEAYNATESDTAAGKQVGISQPAFRNWRRSAGLPPKFGAYNPGEHQRRLAAYHDTDSDNAASQHLGITPMTFTRWRRQQGLRRKTPPPKVDADEDRRRLAAYYATTSDSEASQQLGIPRMTLYSWRQRRNLPARINFTLPREQQRLRNTPGTSAYLAFKDAYEGSNTDVEAGNRLGVSPETFRQWRIGQELPAKTNRLAAPLLEDEETRRLRAYHEHGDDGPASKALGIPKSTFRSWRISRLLLYPPTGPAPKPLPATPSTNTAPEDKYQERVAAYEAYPNDATASEALGIPKGTFQAWRKRAGLPAKQELPKVLLSPEAHAERMHAYEATISDKDAATFLAIPTTTFTKWRTRNGLPPRAAQGVAGLTPAENKRRRHAYQEHDTDQAAAAALDLSVGAFRGWRRLRGLPNRRGTNE